MKKEDVHIGDILMYEYCDVRVIALHDNYADVEFINMNNAKDTAMYEELRKI